MCRPRLHPKAFGKALTRLKGRWTRAVCKEHPTYWTNYFPRVHASAISRGQNWWRAHVNVETLGHQIVKFWLLNLNQFVGDWWIYIIGTSDKYGFRVTKKTCKLFWIIDYCNNSIDRNLKTSAVIIVAAWFKLSNLSSNPFFAKQFIIFCILISKLSPPHQWIFYIIKLLPYCWQKLYVYFELQLVRYSIKLIFFLLARVIR
jgi:hypothetical protein